ncbi:MAG TPA: hypothetical protein VIC51_08630 [Psychromonas sp.]
MIRNFVIIAFLLSAVAACDSSDKTMEQDKAEEMPVEQLNEDVQNKDGDMLDSVKDTTGDAVDGTKEMADDVSDATMEAYDDSKDATNEVVDDINQKMDDETK